MRKILLTLSAAALLAAVGSAWAQPRELPARLATLSGQAETYKKDGTTWEPAKLRAELSGGDGVRTKAGGRVTFLTNSGQALRLGARSTLFLVAPDASAADGPARARLDAGWLWVAVVPGSPASSQIEVRVGPAVVTVREGGVGLRMNRDGSTLVRVYHGAALCKGLAAGHSWQRSLAGEQELFVPASGAAGQPQGLTRDKIEETWVRWNQEQDFAGEYGGKAPDTK